MTVREVVMGDSDPTLVSVAEVCNQQIRVAIAQRRPDGDFDILGVGKSKSQGIYNGRVVREREATEAFREAVEEAELLAQTKVGTVNLGLFGDYFRVEPMHCRFAPNSFMQMHSVRRENEQILHVVPIDPPLESTQSNTALNALVVTAAKSPLRRLLTCAAEARLSVDGLYYTPLLYHHVLIPQEEWSGDHAIIDFGGSHTTMIGIRNGCPIDITVVPAGGRDITNDVSVEFGTNFNDAEYMKIVYGYANDEDSLGYKVFPFRFANFRDISIFYSITLARVIEKGLTTILQPLIDHCWHSLGTHLRPRYITITGGSSQIKGLNRNIRNGFNLSCRHGAFQGIHRGRSANRDPSLHSLYAMLFTHFPEEHGLDAFLGAYRLSQIERYKQVVALLIRNLVRRHRHLRVLAGTRSWLL